MIDLISSYLIELLIATCLLGTVITFLAPDRIAGKLAFLFSLLPLGGSLWMFMTIEPAGNVLFDASAGAFESPLSGTTVVDLGTHEIQWIAAVDGLSLPLIVLSTLLTTLAIVSAWTPISSQQARFYGLMLFLEAALIGIFSVLDFFVWFVFWEAVLIPMYFLIGIWGGPQRKYAAIKFFIYTNVASLIMFIGMLALIIGLPVESFSLIEINAALHADALSTVAGVEPSVLRTVAFFALFLGFAVKVPIVPVHTWLPDAHVEAPAPVSVLLAGALLKMGTYALLRYNYTMLPDIAAEYAVAIAAIAVVTVLYGALLAMAQRDLKRIVAYSSISSMGYVLLGLVAFTTYGIGGATFQMVSHGLLSALLFMAVGIIYNATHTRMVDDMSGLAPKMPITVGIFVAGAFGYMGLPGMSGFAGEIFVFIGAFDAAVLPYAPLFTAVAMFGIVVVAGYLLYAMQRTLFGPFEITTAAHEHDDLTRAPVHDVLSLFVLLGLIVLLGVAPEVILEMIETATEPIINGGEI